MATKDCDGQQYDDGSHICCGNQVIGKYDDTEKCCNGNEAYNSTTYGCCTQGTFDKSTHECCGGFIVSLGECCGGQILSLGESCCGGEILSGLETCCGDTKAPDSNPDAFSEYSCCTGSSGDRWYHPDDECCSPYGWTTTRDPGEVCCEDGTAGESCCGGSKFLADSYKCCNDTQIAINKYCCNGQESETACPCQDHEDFVEGVTSCCGEDSLTSIAYDPSKSSCCGGDTDSPALYDEQNGEGCCKGANFGKSYDTETQCCSEGAGVVSDKADKCPYGCDGSLMASTQQCCGNKTKYVEGDEYCCDDVVQKDPCPEPTQSESNGSITGDPHVKTFFGESYDL